MKTFLVNPLLRWGWFFLILLGGCGFQLNRNQVGLPAGARHISLAEVSNQTFIPRLDIDLKQRLAGLFSRASVPVKSVQAADLAFKVVIVNSTQSREDLAEFNGQTYRFVVIHTALLSVTDNRTGKMLFDKAPVDGRFDFETQSTQLTTDQTLEARRKALDQLAQGLANKLTQNF
ncbi:MAG: LPS assembly lipoprotein LptE [bacterium]|nr:LPS assembly lipoprotein LptE [bacterium]